MYVRSAPNLQCGPRRRSLSAGRGILTVGNTLWSYPRRFAANSRTVERWRHERYRRFMELCRVRPSDTIIDVGAGRGAGLERFNDENEIVAIDLDPLPTEWLEKPNVTLLKGDATKLPYSDGEFDVAFSNSVIEHMAPASQVAFASEVRRVARRYYVQTPNYWFPVEPHYHLPGFQFLPEESRRWLNSRFTLGWQPKGAWEPIHLLDERSLQLLFPDASIEAERLLGLKKSLMAIRT